MNSLAVNANVVTPPRVLFVDDENNILSSLRRLFRSSGYELEFAENGNAALGVMAAKPVDVIVSDMRMPEMDGARLLESVASRWPSVVRILLTGYSDLASTITAVNKGQIFRYISKPWDDAELRRVLAQAAEHKSLIDTRERLTRIIERKNDELSTLNDSLEQKVLARTAELEQMMGMLDAAYQDMRGSYFDIVRVFGNLIALRANSIGDHARDVARVAKNMARHLRLSDKQIEDVVFAALLHDIGKLTMPDYLLYRPFVSLRPGEQEQVRQFPIIGETLLNGIRAMHDVARIVRAQRENFDGSGHPDGLSGQAIPIGARIVAVANAFVHRKRQQRSPAVDGDAVAALEREAGTKFDPATVAALRAVVLAVDAPSVMDGRDKAIRVDELQPGAVLSRDLFTADGVLLLAEGAQLDGATIARLRQHERAASSTTLAYVYDSELAI